MPEGRVLLSCVSIYSTVSLYYWCFNEQVMLYLCHFAPRALASIHITNPDGDRPVPKIMMEIRSTSKSDVAGASHAHSDFSAGKW